jgi:hypothetical protein
VRRLAAAVLGDVFELEDQFAQTDLDATQAWLVPTALQPRSCRNSGNQDDAGARLCAR